LRERYTSGWLFIRYTIARGLFSYDLLREGGKHPEKGNPLPLAEVFDDAFHVLCSPWAPVLCIEWLPRVNEVTSGVHLVCAFNLIGGNISMAALGEPGCTAPQ